MKRYKHNLSNYKLATMDMGKLVPVQFQEVLPGDTFQLETSALVRVSPMLAPVMHPVTVRLHHWFVPTRLVWDKWEDFITGGPDGMNADTLPTCVQGSSAAGGVMDYLGVPPVEGLEVCCLPKRAYNLIWNEFYRDQDLQEERGQGDNSLANVSWSKDYFTTARPFTQKGNDLTLPLGDSAPVVGIGRNPNITASTIPINVVETGGSTVSYSHNVHSGQNSSGIYGHIMETDSNGNPLIFADLSQATGVTANDFREFFALQRYAEARARDGSRYTEYLRYLGVKPSDARLQRPEYLGGGKSTLQFSEVLQTAEGTNPVGEMRGHGIGALKSKRTRRFFEEHGFIITLMSVVPKSIYTDGVQRFFLKQDKEDFFQRELQNIGQQEVMLGEVYCADTEDTRETFGYSNRYSEYTWTPSTVTGEFRSLLDYWHLGRKFDNTPILNQSFVECNPSKRIHAVQTNDVLWCMINNKSVARRMVKNVNVGGIL